MDQLNRQGLKPRRPSGTDRIYFPDPDEIEVQLSSVDHHARVISGSISLLVCRSSRIFCASSAEQLSTRLIAWLPSALMDCSVSNEPMARTALMTCCSLSGVSIRI